MWVFVLLSKTVCRPDEPPWSSLCGCRTWAVTQGEPAWQGQASCGSHYRDTFPLLHSRWRSHLHYLANTRKAGGISKNLQDMQRVRCRRGRCDVLPPDVLVLTSPPGFSVDACLSTPCLPALLRRLRLQLLLRARDVRGELIVDIGCGLSKPACHGGVNTCDLKLNVCNLLTVHVFFVFFWPCTTK